MSLAERPRMRHSHSLFVVLALAAAWPSQAPAAGGGSHFLHGGAPPSSRPSRLHSAQRTSGLDRSSPLLPPTVTVRPRVAVLDRTKDEGIAAMNAIKERLGNHGYTTFPVAEALRTPGRFRVVVDRGYAGKLRFEVHTVDVAMEENSSAGSHAALRVTKSTMEGPARKLRTLDRLRKHGLIR